MTENFGLTDPIFTEENAARGHSKRSGGRTVRFDHTADRPEKAQPSSAANRIAQASTSAMPAVNRSR